MQDPILYSEKNTLRSLEALGTAMAWDLGGGAVVGVSKMVEMRIGRRRDDGIDDGPAAFDDRDPQTCSAKLPPY